MSRFAGVLSSFDDYPIHQTSRPVAHTASTDLNHYDRYFFNGYTRDTRLFFATAMGLYPNRHVADASFSVVVDGGTPDARQISVHASRRAPADRAEANEVGPIRVEVLEPLHALRLEVDAPEHGLRADLTFVRRSAPIEEPHFLQQVGMRVVFDYTRLTQFGGWEGWIEVDGEVTDLVPGETLGSRDRSWGSGRSVNAAPPVLPWRIPSSSGCGHRSTSTRSPPTSTSTSCTTADAGTRPDSSPRWPARRVPCPRRPCVRSTTASSGSPEPVGRRRS